MAQSAGSVRRRKLEPDQLLARTAPHMDLQAALTHEERLAHAHRPAETRLERIGEVVSVLRNDGVAFLQPQHALRFHAKRTEPRIDLHQRIPHPMRGCERHMNLESQRGNEPGAQYARGHARHLVLHARRGMETRFR